LSIKRDNVLWITLAGDGAFAKSAWAILGILKDWNKDEWNVPIFKTKDVLRGFPVAVFYDEKLEEIDRKKITEEEANKIKWKNGIAGTGFIEEELSDLL
jgi:hypothetical protein